MSQAAIIELQTGDGEFRIATLSRLRGKGTPVVFLHGFGSTKEDYADFALRPQFDDVDFLAYDAPFCGQSSCSDPGSISIPVLVRTARALLDALRIERCHLVGHSMGGLTSLLLAAEQPARVAGFANIEGNVAPEDCFLSRQIALHPGADDETFFAEFIERARHSRQPASALYAAGLRSKVDWRAVRGVFESMVQLSDHGELMKKFLGLPCPRMFMHGDANAGLSYLEHLAECGVEVASITDCGHFPMYSNPVQMWQRIAGFIR